LQNYLTVRFGYLYWVASMAVRNMVGLTWTGQQAHKAGEAKERVSNVCRWNVGEGLIWFSSFVSRDRLKQQSFMSPCYLSILLPHEPDLHHWQFLSRTLVTEKWQSGILLATLVGRKESGKYSLHPKDSPRWVYIVSPHIPLM
jgi:hypothetical protein